MNYVVTPGEILKEYMDSRGLTQKDLSSITSTSERHISELINGKVKLSEEFALKLEKVFDDVKAEFWVSIETAYRLYALREYTFSKQADLKTLSKEFQFNWVFPLYKKDVNRQASEMLKLLGITSFSDVDNSLKQIKYDFMEDGGSKRAILVWLKLCESMINEYNRVDPNVKFDLQVFNENLPILKKLLYTTDFIEAKNNIQRFLNSMGISLVVCDAVPTSKIRGACTVIDKTPTIFLSTRYKRLDILYFTLVHEIGHILQNDINQVGQYLVSSNENDIEIFSNNFARDFFINRAVYSEFVNLYKNSFDFFKHIVPFSIQNRVIPQIVLGFLQHDGYVDHMQFAQHHVYIEGA